MRFHVTTVAVFFLTQYLNTIVESANFGEYCNETVHCDSEAWLTCTADPSTPTSTCQCTNGKTMTYDQFKLKCVSKVYEKCHQASEDALTVEVGSSSPECGTHANCSTNLTCGCDPGFFVNGDGLCSKVKTFGENCTRSEECFDGAFLTCMNGKCDCPPNTAYVAYFFHQCVGLAGQNCNPDSNCIYNSKCASGTCTCKADFTQNVDGRCGAGKNSHCSLQTACVDRLICMGQSCQCPQYDRQRYHTESKKCLSLLHAFCSADSDCTENAICQLNLRSGRKHCACAPGYLADQSAECRILAEGTPCTHDRDSHRDTCDRELICRNGICSCRSTTTAFDSKSGKCVGRVGTPCHPDALGYGANACVHGATCEQQSLDTFGQCYCQQGYSFTSEGFCEKLNMTSKIIGAQS